MEYNSSCATVIVAKLTVMRRTRTALGAVGVLIALLLLTAGATVYAQTLTPQQQVQLHRQLEAYVRSLNRNRSRFSTDPNIVLDAVTYQRSAKTLRYIVRNRSLRRSELDLPKARAIVVAELRGLCGNDDVMTIMRVLNLKVRFLIRDRDGRTITELVFARGDCEVGVAIAGWTLDKQVGVNPHGLSFSPSLPSLY